MRRKVQVAEKDKDRTFEVREICTVTLPKEELPKEQQEVLGWILEHCPREDFKCTKP
jgi:hypothetical protein